MKLHPGYEWDIFHILTSEDIADIISLFFVYFFLFSKHSYLKYVIKRKLHFGLKIWSLSFRGKNISRVSTQMSEIFFPLNDKTSYVCGTLYAITDS